MPIPAVVVAFVGCVVLVVVGGRGEQGARRGCRKFLSAYWTVRGYVSNYKPLPAWL